MRSFLLGAASIAAMLVPTGAFAQTGGYVDISAGQLNIEDEDLDVLSLGGAAAADVTENWRAQFDANVNRFSIDGDGFTMTNAAAHLYYEGAGWAAGGVLTNLDLGFVSIWSAGAEGQIHLGQLVLEGELGFGTLESFGDSVNTTNANANATYYFTDNFSIGAGVDTLDTDDAFGTITTYNLEGEYQFAGSANSAFAGYDNTSYDDIDVDSDTWRIGFRHAFGADTLQGRRETGPRWLQVRNNNAIFGLMGPSDRRLKRDITLLATLENGMQIYSFRYLWSDTVYVGLMAQDLLVHRDWRTAVIRQANGFYVVNYASLGMRMTTLEEWNRNGLASVTYSENADNAVSAAA